MLLYQQRWQAKERAQHLQRKKRRTPVIKKRREEEGRSQRWGEEYLCQKRVLCIFLCREDTGEQRNVPTARRRTRLTKIIYSIEQHVLKQEEHWPLGKEVKEHKQTIHSNKSSNGRICGIILWLWQLTTKKTHNYVSMKQSKGKLQDLNLQEVLFIYGAYCGRSIVYLQKYMKPNPSLISYVSLKGFATCSPCVGLSPPLAALPPCTPCTQYNS